jgi:hypothetical protein
MQEDVENRSVALTTRTAKLTAQTLARLMRAALRRMRESDGALEPGRQSLKQLAKGGSLSSVEITEGNIKSFEPVARKYGVSYDLKRDGSSDPPRWTVFFRAKDADAMTAAFKEFSAKMVKNKDGRRSVRDDMQKYGEIIANAVRDKTKHRRRKDPER